MTPEEEKAALELEEGSKNEKSELAKIGEGLGEVQNLLKSQVVKKEDPKKEIDFEGMSPEEIAEKMSKSFVGSKDAATSFVTAFAEYAGVNAQDMFDENGEQFITDDMRKSLDESAEKGERFMSALLYSQEEATKRAQKTSEVLFNALQIFGKSISGLVGEHTKMNEIVEEMKKSMVVEPKTGDQEIPNMEGEAADPLSKIEHESGSTTLDYNTQMGVLQKSFPMDGTIEQQSSYQRYASLVDNEVPFEQIISGMPVYDKQVVKGNLLEFQGA